MNKRLINKIGNYFKKQPVIRAFLFGSEARNEATPDSDIDIFVELDHSKPIGLKFIRMQQELKSILHKEVDLISKPSKYIVENIEKEKILIYEKKIK